MKKLMIAAAIVCAATCSQALTSFTVNWGITANGGQLQGADGSAYAGKSIYLCYKNTEAIEEALLSGGDWAALTCGSATTDSGALVGLAHATVMEDENEFGYGETVDVSFLQVDGLKYRFSYDGFTALLEDGPTAAADPNSIFDGADINNSSFEWKTIPEPTSGLLMLLGFAGLALKRKRA